MSSNRNKEKMMRKVLEVAAVAALIVGAAGVAQAGEFNGAEQIARGDYRAAELMIVAQQRMFPRDADLLLNLATVYARTGRTAEARRLYQAVTTQPNVELDTAGRQVAWSHVLAADALGQLNTQVATVR